MKNQCDDIALVNIAVAGDRKAFEQLLSRHYHTIYKIAYQWCGDKTDAQDITQNVCIKLARAIHSFKGDSAFTSWLYPLVINTAKDWQRQQSKANQKHTDIHDMEIAVKPKMDQSLYIQQVLTAVCHLPDREKEALLLVASAGLSHVQAASALGCQESTVSWRIHQARKKLNTLFIGGQA